METHVKVLGILNIVHGALGLCFALLLVVVFGGVAGAIAADSAADATMALPIIGFTGFAVVSTLVLSALPSFIIGYGLYRLQRWARIAGIVLAILSLVMFPFGTALGIYGLWVLFSREGERLFTAVQTVRPSSAS